MSNGTQQFMQDVARGLDSVLNEPGDKRNGFVVLVFPLNEPEGQRVNYVSNVEREEVVSALKEVAERFEADGRKKH